MNVVALPQSETPTACVTAQVAPSIVLRGVGRRYKLGKVDVPALDDINLDIGPDELTVLSGPSGSGKSTLLNIMGCLDTADSGQVMIAGHDVAIMGVVALSDLRAKRIGFVFQNFNLLPVLTAYENVEYPLRLLGLPAPDRARQTTRMLEQVGLAGQAGHLPGELSGGQRQRVAIARALVKQPDIVLADEPTANLDTANGDAVLVLMRELQRHTRTAIVISSHDPRVVAVADRVVRLHDGKVVRT
ncbi:ABC transporter ATP-binding protein [Xanthomonas hydrangeae]|uniref:ABC transporter ATP-binding protein n=1 Tax=Xanthomonas hydrangeae TaxID=2775159 RepID=A0AAU0B7F5_9XANT|nr:ABC transporter ATP-binding protein [Xanthomonas hydrangeae]WOB47940.1 ABC transporter ATP-binding protein [Xanthomonas hydrangeae]